MSKHMPLDDFRAIRTVLEEEDYALSSGTPGKLHTTACYLRRNWVISSLREALRVRYSEKWELENLLVNLEFDSFQLSGECVTILHEPMRMEVPDLLCVTG